MYGVAFTMCSIGLNLSLSNKNDAFIFFSSDEVDVIPCIQCQEGQNNEREDPFVIVNHKLGIRAWCIKPLFLFAYKKLVRSHREGKKDYNVSGIVIVLFCLGLIISDNFCNL